MKQQSLTKLSIVKAEYYAYHGVKNEEKQLGGKYEVDLDMYYDAKTAIINDEVRNALNYEEAMFCISEAISNESYNLVETLAHEILSTILDKFPILVKATVRLRKMAVPMRRVVSHIEVEQTIERD